MFDKIFEFITSDDKFEKLVLRMGAALFLLLIFILVSRMTLTLFIIMLIIIAAGTLLGIIAYKSHKKQEEEAMREWTEDDGVTGYIAVSKEEVEQLPWETAPKKIEAPVNKEKTEEVTEEEAPEEKQGEPPVKEDET